MTNLIFAQKGTPVVEYITPEIMRPWLFLTGASLGMKWWPVILSSFDASEEIFRSVAVVKEALKDADASIA